MSESRLSRRDFVKVGAAGAAGVALQGGGQAAAAASSGQAPPMPERPLGRTGHNVRLFSLGGQATIEQPNREEDSMAIVNRAIDLGVNYVDTAAAYGRNPDGPPYSQTYIGKVMKDRRNEVFLASKTHDRSRDGSLRLLEQSLELLNTDHLDLWQLHNISTTRQLDQIFADDGAIHAMVEAREQGMVRFLGITGHADPDVLLDGINRFDFDTILMALNPADPHYLPFMENLLPAANRKGMGVIAMKIPARGRIFREGGITGISQAMTWVLSQPVSTCIIGCDDVAQLEENVAVARDFKPLNSMEMRRIEGLVADYPQEASFFKRGAAGFGRGMVDDQQFVD